MASITSVTQIFTSDIETLWNKVAVPDRFLECLVIAVIPCIASCSSSQYDQTGSCSYSNTPTQAGHVEDHQQLIRKLIEIQITQQSISYHLNDSQCTFNCAPTANKLPRLLSRLQRKANQNKHSSCAMRNGICLYRASHTMTFYSRASCCVFSWQTFNPQINHQHRVAQTLVSCT